jgi:hypothetical protein
VLYHISGNFLTAPRILVVILGAEKIILKLIKKELCVDWIKVTENKVQWQCFPNAVLSVGFDVEGEELLRLTEGL